MPDSSFVLGIGGALTESVTSKIKATGGRYVHRLLSSTPEDWHRSSDLFHSDSVCGVVAKDHGGDYPPGSRA